MIKELKDENSKLVPWKNGGGFTRELYRLPDPNNPDDFLLRISKAHIPHNGPFSFFPGTDRLLLLLAGEGVNLHFKNHSLVLNKLHVPLSFSGEEEVQCELIQNECIDFNIMTKSHWGYSEVNVYSLDDYKRLNFDHFELVFIYHLENEMVIIVKSHTLKHSF